VANGLIQDHLRILADKGRQRAFNAGRDVLVSTVFEVRRTHLPSLFSFEHKRFYGTRFFWSEPGRKLALAGLGCALQIEADDVGQRFGQVERQWREATRGCIVQGEAPAYTGPHLFGGFSFDPLNAKSEEWQHYPHTRFVLPEIMWTEYEGRTWVTISRLISREEAHESIDAAWEDDLRIIEQLAGAGEELPPAIEAEKHIYKEEIAPIEWMHAVERAAASIRDGQMRKVVLARQMKLYADRPFDVREILGRLLREQNNTYVFAIESGPDCFVGATPERLVESKDGRLSTLSLAGTIGRGQTDEEDRQYGEFLFHDEKNLHEHALAVEMIRDAMRQLCERVELPDAPILYRLKDVQHLLTPISGRAREGVTLLQAIEALHPTPALGGMPREAAIEAIRELERMDRGWYAAPIGWLNLQMDGEFAAAIRSALVSGKEALLYAGCGIVGDSVAASEYQETALKFRPMLSALGALDSESAS
jgi:menaquinone-specific isochorismate synthase